MEQVTINQPIKLIFSAENKQIKPLLFFWNGRVIKDLTVNFCHIVWQGREKIYTFSVSNQSAGYCLIFNAATLECRLKEIINS